MISHFTIEFVTFQRTDRHRWGLSIGDMEPRDLSRMKFRSKRRSWLEFPWFPTKKFPRVARLVLEYGK